MTALTLTPRLHDALSRVIPLMQTHLTRYTQNEHDRSPRRRLLDRLNHANQLQATVTFDADDETVMLEMLRELARHLDNENAVPRDIAPSIALLAALSPDTAQASTSWLMTLAERPFNDTPTVEVILPTYAKKTLATVIFDMTHHDALLDRADLSRRRTNAVRREVLVACHTDGPVRLTESVHEDVLHLIETAREQTTRNIRFESYAGDILNILRDNLTIVTRT